MNYEQKYREALERAKQVNDGGLTITPDQVNDFNVYEYIFPELKESEDEKIRKELISFFTKRDEFTKSEPFDGLSNKQIIAWLEKQGEQKTEIEYIYPKFRIGDVIVPIKPNGYYPPVRVLSIEKKTKSYYCESDDHKHYSSIPIRCENEYKLVEQNPSWSEEDEERLNSIIEVLDDNSLLVQWLKSIKDRVQPKPNQEWSKYDKIQLSEAIQMIEANGTWIRSEDAVKKMSNWLKSIKPNHWKPSDKQLNEVKNAIGVTGTNGIVLLSLYNDLLKL